MGKIKWLIYGIVVILIATGWYVHKKETDDTYSGMSIIPERQKDIPLFKGLEPTDHEYVMKGNHWKAIYDFYQKQLPKHGWKVEYKQASSNSSDDITGFDSSWRKPGQDWELTITGSYFKTSNQTEVIFNKLPILHATTWIEKNPESICIYQKANDEDCSVNKKPKEITKIVQLINSAIDWDKKVQPRENTSQIVVGKLKIKVLYEGDKEVYLQSEKGTKVMKPEPEFFQLTKLQ